jgi:predicted nuclease of predicted toxin-antitoxin system
MQFLADENIPLLIVKWLRSSGHNVASAAEISAGAADVEWLARAESEGRLILTSDKDFGELVFRDRCNSHGVILLRLESLPIDLRLNRLKEAWGVIEANPSGRFIVVTPRRVRVKPLR